MTALAIALLSMVSAPSPAERPETVHILAIELSADGGGGTILAQPVQLAGEDRALRFGEGACRKHPIAERVLEQLFSAMERQREVAFETERVGDSDCVRRVRFIGPLGG